MLQFLGGLVLCATGVWLSLQAGLGVSPWDVLHAGVATWTGLSFGTVVAGVGVVVVVLSALLGVRPGLGTFVNILLIGAVLDLLLAASWLDGLPEAALALRILALLAAVALLGTGAALYIGAGFGAGPRDSLMVACHLRGWPIGVSRVVIEVSVVAAGWLLGGPVGAGTVVMALALGPATQVAFRVLRQEPAAHSQARAAAAEAAADAGR
ncbi:putative membrane protein YczE [Kineococcus xinjiangensis]|uniref:Putative membrane protein YczE n=1 Tax=Kineococcus xinjiangensis TaxID=512762 RepID=A0A2S6IUY8_9ACTN|nr:putative membrane protein YczE [Kineococcus xinjiangensis]